MSAPALLACAAAAVALALPVLAGAGALTTQARAAGAADAAALAAADALSGWAEGEPCALATRVVEAHELSLDECVLDAAEGRARVRVSGVTAFGTVRGSAHAGPSRAIDEMSATGQK